MHEVLHDSDCTDRKFTYVLGSVRPVSSFSFFAGSEVGDFLDQDDVCSMSESSPYKFEISYAILNKFCQT